ncbi:MAG TPA: hypothetical protein VFW84_01370 [Aquabacterium sp.]|uniref:hypothetical protein n=1 Tax=Aquabacterium sp. TaxID=1872578 RepID=UPI002D976348|nr:hypothetical protein [Aquabacterium sp.]HET6788261.1 hypothetical protein [Aquabacterium sp.]HEX5371361.1 hypothetical protein [Aquabacterium sp.]
MDERDPSRHLAHGTTQISPFKVKLTEGTRHGVVTVDGQAVEALLDDLVARTPEVIAQVTRQLPDGFPPALADSVFQGLVRASERLRA